MAGKGQTVDEKHSAICYCCSPAITSSKENNHKTCTPTREKPMVLLPPVAELVQRMLMKHNLSATATAVDHSTSHSQPQHEQVSNAHMGQPVDLRSGTCQDMEQSTSD